MIKLIILGQTLSIVTSKVVAGTHRYLEVEGDFKGDDWEDFRKWVHFRDPGRTVHYVLPMHEDKITAEQMLDLTAGTWDVHVHGNYAADDDDLVRIETEVRQLFVEGDESGAPFPPLTPEFEEILANDVEQALDIAKSVRDDADAGEFDGATFTPSVDDEGNISWTNDQGKENPETKNIRGPQGLTGDSGVYIGTTEPEDPVKNVWINPEGGVGRVITSIDTAGTHQPGTYDTYTLHFNEGEDLVLRVYNGVDGEGTGDMVKNVYDPQNKATDIFEYADERIFDVTYNSTTYSAIQSALSAGKIPYIRLFGMSFAGQIQYNGVFMFNFFRVVKGDPPHLNLYTVTQNNVWSITTINLPGDMTIDSAMSGTSTNPVQNRVITAALAEKADADSLADVATSGSYNDLTDKPTIPPGATVDAALSSTSTNPVQNKVIKQALDNKQDALTIDSAMSGSSTNPVQNRAIKQYVDSKIGIKKGNVSISVPPIADGSYQHFSLSIPTGRSAYAIAGVALRYGVGVAMYTITQFEAIGSSVVVALSNNSGETTTETRSLDVSYLYTE